MRRSLDIPITATMGALFFFLAPPAEAISVTDWNLVIGAQDLTSGEVSAHAFRTVQNPFVDQYTGALSDGLTTASAQYNFSWLLDSGSFNMTSQQQAHSPPSHTIQTGSFGSIQISTLEPLSLSIDASWAYDLPADWMMTHMDVNVRAADSSDFLFIQEYQVQTSPWEPQSGTLTIQGDVTLTPDHTWILSYSLRLEAEAGANYSATGDGYVHFAITPEASSLALLLLAAAPLARRRTQRHARR